MTTRVVLGNRHAIQSHDNGGSYTALPKGKRATVADWDDVYTFSEIIEGTTNPARGVWAHAAVGPDDEVVNDAGETVHRGIIHADAKPAWVASSNPLVAQVLAQHYGDIEIRELEETEGHPFPADLQPKSKKSAGGGTHFVLPEIIGLLLLVPLLGYLLASLLPLLKTNGGSDFQYNQMAGTASATAVGKWVGITANTTAPAATDTTLTGEITTAGGGLIRKVSTPAHTTGVASYTLTTVFTANGTDSLPVTIGKRGVFDQLAVGGTMIFETLVSPTATLSASGDNLTLTDTVTM